MTKYQYLSLLGFFFSSSVVAQHTCKTAIDREQPAGIEGKYEIIGRLPHSNQAYVGSLYIQIDQANNRYHLTRTINNQTVIGTGCFHHWGDNVSVFNMTFVIRKRLFTESCAYQSDGDNYFRLSCLTAFTNAPSTQPGLESAFQVTW